MTKKLSKNQKIMWTVVIILIAIILLTILSGGTEIGFVKLPSLGKSIIVNIDVERTLFDVKLVKTSIEIKQGILSIAPLGIFPSPLGEKKLILKMSINGEVCDTKEFTIEGRGVVSKRFSCKAKVGSNNVKIELYDTKGLEDLWETNFFVK